MIAERGAGPRLRRRWSREGPMRKKFRPEPAWGSSSGLLDIPPRGGETVPAQLIAEVQQLVHRYTWGTDERLPELLDHCFTDDAVWEASVMGETRVGPFSGRAQVLDWFTRFWPVQKDHAGTCSPTSSSSPWTRAAW